MTAVGIWGGLSVLLGLFFSRIIHVADRRRKDAAPADAPSDTPAIAGPGEKPASVQQVEEVEGEYS